MQVSLNGQPMALSPLFFTALNLSPAKPLPPIEYPDDTQPLIEAALEAGAQQSPLAKSKRLRAKPSAAETRQQTKEIIAGVKQFIATREEERVLQENLRQQQYHEAHWKEVAKVPYLPSMSVFRAYARLPVASTVPTLRIITHTMSAC